MRIEVIEQLRFTRRAHEVTKGEKAADDQYGEAANNRPKDDRRTLHSNENCAQKLRL